MIGPTVDDPSPFTFPLTSLPSPEPPLLPPPQAPKSTEAPNTVVPTNCHFSLKHPPNINNQNVICISYRPNTKGLLLINNRANVNVLLRMRIEL